MMTKLIVVGTPIGNLEDISWRALKALDEVETLICEDTRVTGKLLQAYRDRGWLKNKPKLIAYNDFNARQKLDKLKEVIKREEVTGLVSDAGMPLISDPGYRIVHFCYQEGIEVEVIPGPSAVIEAVVLANLGGDKFMFYGFLPKKSGKLRQSLEKIKAIWEIEPDVKMVLFVSPHRIKKDLEVMIEVLGPKKRGVLLREMTKKFEERVEMDLDSLKKWLDSKKIKGELVLVLTAV